MTLPAARAWPRLRSLALSLLAIPVLVSACGEDTPRWPPPTSVAPLGWVDVRLERGGVFPTLGSPGPWEVLGGIEGDLRAASDEPFSSRELRRAEAEIFLGDLSLGRAPVELRPRSSLPLQAGDRSYRGVFRIEIGEEFAMRLVNRLPVEDYLRGVLPAEMPDRFGFEALKAQAVAARSYALSEFAERGFLWPSIRHQVYDGLDGESHASSQAVSATSGQILSHEGQVFPAWFHAVCGGASEPAASIFPFAPVDVLDQVLPCTDCEHAPFFAWTRTVDAERVSRAAGLVEAPLESVSVDPTDLPGRPRTITVRAGGREGRVSAETFRARVSAGRSRDESLLSTRWAAAPQIEGGSLVIEGRGWGHGVGLCQYGAGGRASRGESYRAILAHYYPGVVLAQLL